MGVWSCCKGVTRRYLPLDKFANLNLLLNVTPACGFAASDPHGLGGASFCASVAPTVLTALGANSEYFGHVRVPMAFIVPG
jgi:hypothetical protein